MGKRKRSDDISTFKELGMVADLVNRFAIVEIEVILIIGTVNTFRNCITKFIRDLAESASPMLAAFSNKSATETLDRRARYSIQA